ncbi:hypothetical protein KZ810_07995 [Sphingomonas sp. RHCKR47]|uniref:hypothetical protein n=1 Tax=Sphingomonas citricola TaxID=2862498 RepID=UPI001CA52021|nr:hypothetical protein [Sphingomonas citricola]MBW6523438.1 hypothetical protein [Sphingomonas citricola]
MSRRLDVLNAVKQLMTIAVPGAEVLGLDGKDMAPSDVPAAGRVIVRAGVPTLTETTLSPLTYWYDHEIPVEVYGFRSGGITREEALDTMLVGIGEQIEADRTLRGLIDWLDTSAPETDDLASYTTDGDIIGKPERVTTLTLTASYSTSGPLA